MVEAEAPRERRGARTPSQVPADVVLLLQSGTAETVNLMEQMAIDMGALLTTLWPHLVSRAPALRDGGLLARMRHGGRVLLEEFGTRTFEIGCTHPSDTVRGWAAMAIGCMKEWGLERQLHEARAFANDNHFAVREWAWLAVRPSICAQPLLAIESLRPWAHDPSPYIRRFASEATRPRGVWSAHIPLLKESPSYGAPVLELLKNDRTRYVEDSVANWLNDAAKSQPLWVRELCDRWLQQDEGAARLCRRAMRSIS